MRNPITRDKANKERQRFIESLDTEAICRLASSYHGGLACKTFGTPKHGSFNVCVFVEFDTSPPEKWAVRIPVPARAACIDERIETELATMKYVTAKTSIPVPRVHAYSFSEGSPIGSPFIMMDYVEGQILKDLGFKKGRKWASYTRPTEATEKLHQQLADVYVQLRGLEFPAIGALGLPIVDGKPSFDCDPDEICVRHRPLSIEMIMQELEGMDPGARVPPGTTFSTARSFVEALLWLADNEFDKSPDAGLDMRGARNALFARHHFDRFVRDQWLDAEADAGPFVLMHGDMLMLSSNLLFDAELNLVGLLDWEWSYVVPAQMLAPPVWLSGGAPEWMLVGRSLFYTEVKRLVAAIREREVELGVPARLSHEWKASETWCHTAVVTALLAPDLTYDTYWDLVFYRTEEPRGEADFKEFYLAVIRPRLDAFMEVPERRALVARKEEEQRRFFEEEKEHFGYECVRKLATEGGETTETGDTENTMNTGTAEMGK